MLKLSVEIFIGIINWIAIKTDIVTSHFYFYTIYFWQIFHCVAISENWFVSSLDSVTLSNIYSGSLFMHLNFCTHTENSLASHSLEFYPFLSTEATSWAPATQKVNVSGWVPYKQTSWWGSV